MVNNHEHGSCCSSSRWILVVSITCEQGYNSQQTSYWSRKPDTSISCVDYFVCRRQREVTSHSHRKRSCFPCGTNVTENSGTTLSNHYQRSDSLLFSPALCPLCGKQDPTQFAFFCCLLCGCGQNRIQRNSPFLLPIMWVWPKQDPTQFAFFCCPLCGCGQNRIQRNSPFFCCLLCGCGQNRIQRNSPFLLSKPILWQYNWD